MKHKKRGIPDGIAIIGMSGRFPGARSTEEFWRNLRDGVESVSTFTDEELTLAGIPAAVLSEPGFVNAGGVLDGIDKWDAQFFGMNARDAEIMDPQQRLFLECAWDSLENAGYDSEQYDGAIGVYGGMSLSTYVFQIYANADRLAHFDQMQVMLLNDKDHLTTHVSYKLNLTGPSIVVQSACSTSLVAICTACDGLWNHRCDMALAGGVAISVPQRKGYTYQPGGILSPDGHCRAFDAAARGTIPGNGVAIVVLKRLADAIADRDHIYAVIRGAAVNNDGSFKVGYTAPSVVGQANVISMAQTMAGIDPATITYVEAHGTGTQLGDPIEVAALTEAFRVGTDKKGYCAIGSAKTNVGHLDPAAGVTGLIKTALALHHRELPPSLHFEKPNPEIDFDNSPFYVNSKLKPWPSNGIPRRAGVSSFGIGGTNAHCVVEEAPPAEESGDTRSFQLLLLSAKTRTALDTQSSNIGEYLRTHPEAKLADVAYVLQAGRKHFSHRRFLTCPSADVSDAAAKLEQPDAPGVFTNAGDATERPVMFLFPGQGTQYAGMAAQLYRTEITFRQQVDECCKFLVPHLECDLRDLLFATDDTRVQATEELKRTALTQPALFVIEYSLAVLFIEWGVVPQAMIGHSIGEYVAACLAGVFSLEDALLIVAARGRLMDSMPRGAMLAIPASEEEARSAISDNLSLAAVNGPSACVISGPIDEIEHFERRFATRGLPCKRLATSHAFHSSMMDGAVAEFVDVVRSAALNAPSVPYLSNVTGSWMTVDDATDPEYYGRQLRSTVRFADGLSALLKQPEWVYLEVGPGHTLSSLLRQQNAEASKRHIVSSLPAATELKDDVAFTLEALGRLWITGVPVAWKAFNARETRRRIPLPTYPFERQRYWIGPPDKVESADPTGAVLNRRAIADWFYAPTWTAVESVARHTHAAPLQPQNWLLFLDECGVGIELKRELSSQGHNVITAAAGHEFQRISGTEYSIPLTQGRAYDELIEELVSANVFPDQIVHLWLITPENQQDLELLQDRGFRSLILLSQALGKQNSSQDVQLSIVSNGLQAVRESDRISPPKATALGPCRVIVQEYPNISTRSIDVEAGANAADAAVQILNEIKSEPASGPVAYRENTRWLQSFEPIRLEQSPEPKLLRREGGVYVITGGLGGIGLTIASQLAELPGAKLILIGRSPLPSRNDWDDWLASHDKSELTQHKIREIRAMEASGAEVMVAAADVNDRSAMERVLEEAKARFGDIHGVVHSAGIAGGGMIQLKSLEVAASVFAPKVQGAMVLHELLKDTKLDFFAICSSLASVYGGFGQVDYCAANNFMDAYARAYSSPERPVISINWDTWCEVGMAVNTEVPPEMQEARQQSLAKGITPKEGAQAFLRILDAGLPQVAVCTTDLQASLSIAASPTFVEPVETAGSIRTTHDRPALMTAYIAPSSETEQAIAVIWQDLLGVEPVGINDNFFELGGHSLLAIQVISQIRSVFEVEVSIQNLFNAPTVAQLAEHVAAAAEEIGDLETMAQLLDQVERLSDTEVKALLNGNAESTLDSASRKHHAG